MRTRLTLVLATLALSAGISGIATAGEVEKHSLPLAATDVSCQVVNHSDRTIDVIIEFRAAGRAGSRTTRTLAPRGIDGVEPSGPNPPPVLAYCTIRYTGRPADIVGTFCAVDDLGTCAVAVPLE